MAHYRRGLRISNDEVKNPRGSLSAPLNPRVGHLAPSTVRLTVAVDGPLYLTLVELAEKEDEEISPTALLVKYVEEWAAKKRHNSAEYRLLLQRGAHKQGTGSGDKRLKVGLLPNAAFLVRQTAKKEQVSVGAVIRSAFFDTLESK